ncbi:MAG: glycosyl transferase [Hyphomicrobiales bacterium]|nr:MAG: glycosyl transferase [Hyphomicrobiales bacterium]
MPSNTPLRIVHCFRSPVGGIFRHVRDLLQAQHALGHKVGIICDSTTGGAFEDELFEQIKPHLALGLHRIPMSRSISKRDITATWKTYKIIKELKPDIVHSHGAKGGVYGRIAGSLLRVSGVRVARIYCPHGGSIHFEAASVKGKLFFAVERWLSRKTDRFIFVSGYEKDGFIEKIVEPPCAVSLIYNGLSPEEYVPVSMERNPADFLYIGMMRDLKGPDVFLYALAKIRAMEGRENIIAEFVGDGPDEEKYLKQIAMTGLEDCVRVHSAMPARQAFAKAKVVVVPSRAESMPYIVLEAIAGHMPIVVTNVGGIPEIFTDETGTMCKPGDSDALAELMLKVLDDENKKATVDKRANKLAERFSVEVMAQNMETAYRKTLETI